MTHTYDELADVQGRHDRPLAANRWRVPRTMRLDGARLVWEVGDARVMTAGSGLLEGFLAIATEDQVLRYARRWGPLQLCEHGFPQGHPAEYWPTRAIEAHPCPFNAQGRLRPAFIEHVQANESREDRWAEYVASGGTREDLLLEPTAPARPRPTIHEHVRGDFHYCYTRGVTHDRPWEPVSDWLAWVRRTQALLTVVAKLYAGTIADAPEWHLLSDSPEWIQPRTVIAGWQDVDYFVTFWLRAANVRPFLERRDGKVSITWGSGEAGLFGALAVQILLAVTQTGGLAHCAGCGNSFVPSRRPRRDQRQYCVPCRHGGAPQRAAARDYRDREPARKRRKAEREAKRQAKEKRHSRLGDKRR